MVLDNSSNSAARREEKSDQSDLLETRIKNIEEKQDEQSPTIGRKKEFGGGVESNIIWFMIA